MSTPDWQYSDASQSVVMRAWPNGNQESAVITREDVAAWFAAGNVPLPVPPPEEE